MYDRYGKRKFGDAVQDKLDQEVVAILDEQMQVAKRILEEKRELVEEMTQRLLAKKTLMFSDIYDILGDRPFESSQNFKR